MKNITNTKELQEIIIKIDGFKLAENEGNLIIEYFEGHDYVIKANKEKLFIVDIQDEEDICEESFKEIVCRVSEWNDDLIKFTEKDIEGLYETLEQHEEFAMLMSKLLHLKENGKILDNLYHVLTTEGVGKEEEQAIIEDVRLMIDSFYHFGHIEYLDIEKIEVVGSRKNGRYRENSDLDILIKYKSDIKEYKLFNILNGLEIEYEGMDMNFITVHNKEKHIKLYIKHKNGYSLKSFGDLGEGHQEFIKEMKKGDFEYLELAIDNYDINGEYKIVRTMYL